MKVFPIVIFFILLLGGSNRTFSQQLRENEIVVIHGEKFVLHQVRTGETLYGISRRFQVDSNELIRNNPSIQSGLKVGEILKIPYKDNVDLKETSGLPTGDPTRFDYHVIKSRKETPYFIAKQYGITVEQIYSYNPKIKRFRRGTKLRIPRWDVQIPQISDKEVAFSLDQEKILAGEKVGDYENMQVHTVLPGETLYSISKRYQIPENQILLHNPGSENLKAGTQIFIPKQNTTKSFEENTGNKNVGNYFEHIIESGETLWGLTQKYDVSENELKKLNPALEKSFPAGLVIKIPVKEIRNVPEEQINEDEFIKHYVEKGETLFGLAAKYNMNIPEIQKYNPILNDRNLVYGETVLIPRKSQVSEMESVESTAINQEEVQELPQEPLEVEIPLIIPESCKPNNSGFYNFSTYNVALFLPLFLEANDTLNKQPRFLEDPDSLIIDTSIEIDTLVEEEEREDMFVKFYGNSENYIQFYEGVILAIDSMQNAGMRVVLNVFDTEQSADSIRKFIYSDDFLETDLIIGPVYPNVQSEVASIAAKNQIPIVSPLAAQSFEVNSNRYYYQVNPDRNYLAVKTAELVAEEYFNSNFVVVKTRNFAGTEEGKLVDLIQEKLFNSGFLSRSNGVSFSVYDFQNEGPFGLRRILSDTKENVIYVPSSDEGEISVAISNVNNLADDYSITLIGTSRFQQFKSIEIEQFHRMKLKYIAPYWVDYKKPATIDFIRKFKSNFYTEPNSFGMQGYDVAFYFLNAFKNFGKDFENCLPYIRLDLMQGNYNFEKVSAFGGYMNHGVSVISYEPNYKVIRKRIEGQPKLANY